MYLAESLIRICGHFHMAVLANVNKHSIKLGLLSYYARRLELVEVVKQFPPFQLITDQQRVTVMIREYTQPALHFIHVFFLSYGKRGKERLVEVLSNESLQQNLTALPLQRDDLGQYCYYSCSSIRSYAQATCRCGPQSHSFIWKQELHQNTPTTVYSHQS